MQTIQNLVKESKQAFAKADHLVYMTYPTVKEVKLLFSAIETLNTALLKSLDALLLYERLYKRIVGVPKDLNSKLFIYKDYCVRKYDFNSEVEFLIRNLGKMIKARKGSPMEFARGGKLVICSDNFRMRVVDEKMVKGYLTLSRQFITGVGVHINGRRR